MASEVIQALLRAGQVSEASARAEEVLARHHAAELDTPLRVGLLGALALQNRADEVIAVAQASLADSALLRPSDRVMILAQQSWARRTRAIRARASRWQPRARHRRASARRGDDGVGADGVVGAAVGRQGRFGEALVHARRAAALAAGSHDMGDRRRQPKFFLGLALFDCDLVDEAELRTARRSRTSSAPGWVSETLMADAEASFVIGDWDDAVPVLDQGEQAARGKGNELAGRPVARLSGHRQRAQATSGGKNELTAGIAASLNGSQLSYNAGVLAFAVAGLEVSRG